VTSVQHDTSADYGVSAEALPEPTAAADGQSGAATVTKTIVRDQPKVGRNDPCPCGSGKKYKNCHGVNE